MTPDDCLLEHVSFDIHRLVGCWTFDREASDGTMVSGKMTLEDLGKSLRYVENGTMTLLGGNQLSCTREYFFSQSGAKLKISFDRLQSSVFHDLEIKSDSSGFVGCGKHLCLEDTYHSLYRFIDDFRFQTSHRVHGPKKNYTLETSYTRIGV